MKTEQSKKEDGSRTQLASMSEKTHTPADPLSCQQAVSCVQTKSSSEPPHPPRFARQVGWHHVHPFTVGRYAAALAAPYWPSLDVYAPFEVASAGQGLRDV
jgi:hypothetical protein